MPQIVEAACDIYCSQEVITVYCFEDANHFMRAFIGIFSISDPAGQVQEDTDLGTRAEATYDSRNVIRQGASKVVGLSLPRFTAWNHSTSCNGPGCLDARAVNGIVW